MVNSISMPNFHEDQPSALEGELSKIIGSRGPMGAAAMLMAEQNRRGMAQDDYHDQLAGINDLQRQNMLASQRETGIGAFTKLVESKMPGALQAAQQSQFGQFLPSPNVSGQLYQSIQQNADAGNAANLGKGIEGGMIPNVAPSGFSIGVPSQIGAQTEANKGRIGAAEVTANKIPPDYNEQTTVPDLKNPFNTDKSRQYIRPHGIGNVVPPAATNKNVSTPGYPGSPIGNSLLGGVDTSNLNDPNAPPLTTAQTDTGGGPTATAISTKLSNLQASNSAAHTDVLKGAAANGGQPILGKKRDGTNGLVGASGTVY